MSTKRNQIDNRLAELNPYIKLVQGYHYGRRVWYITVDCKSKQAANKQIGNLTSGAAYEFYWPTLDVAHQAIFADQSVWTNANTYKGIVVMKFPTEFPVKFTDIPEEYRCAGLLVHFEDGEKMLIGHCNEQLGWCDCCYDLHDGNLVVKLEWVWSEDGAEGATR